MTTLLLSTLDRLINEQHQLNIDALAAGDDKRLKETAIRMLALLDAKQEFERVINEVK